MPALAIGARGILVGIDLHQRRIVALVGRCGMHMQFAELAAEGEMLVRADVLVAEEDHEIFGERAVDLVHLAIGAGVVRDQLADVDAGDFRADDRGEFFDADGLVGVGFAGDVPITRTLLAGQRSSWAFSRSFLIGTHRSPDGAKRNPGSRSHQLARSAPDFACAPSRATGRGSLLRRSSSPAPWHPRHSAGRYSRSPAP